MAACTPAEPPLSPQARAFKEEVAKVLAYMQESLGELTARNDVPAIDSVLGGLAKSMDGMCIECPYRSAVLNKNGVLLTTFPKSEIIGRNFSAYTLVLEPLRHQKISQRRVFQGDGTKFYFISAPLLHNRQVMGVVALGLTTADVEIKWGITEKEFLAINFNVP
ncbi:MAG: hypothetical protein FJ135_07230 [Deltaproteobacteria bacterium]|nr:hypothetical protein [Deltaproteobacteria bacterium]